MITESKMNYREKRREMEGYKEGQRKVTADRTAGAAGRHQAKGKRNLLTA